MLTKTSISGIRALVHLVLLGSNDPVSPRRIAEELGLSASYLAKIAGYFVKADILRSLRGARGGVVLSRSPERISLLEIVEACQGKILGSFCEHTDRLKQTCAFHRAMSELHDGTIGVLSRWTLKDLAAAPLPSGPLAGQVACRMLDGR